VNSITKLTIESFELLDIIFAIRAVAMDCSQPNPLSARGEGANVNPPLNSWNIDENEKTQLTENVIRHNELQ
jgi:hypothetical protein